MKIGTNYNNFLTEQKVKSREQDDLTAKDTVSIGNMPEKDILVSYYPQDPYVGKPVIGKVPGGDITAGPDNSRIDTMGNVQPNGDGNLIFEETDPAFINVQTFTSVEKTLEVFEKYLGKNITFYGDRAKISIYPDKGKMENAYYMRDDCSLNFFHFRDSSTKQTLYTGKSAEIVQHEAGHAIVDAIKPGWFTSWNAETEALHEACADMTAMVTCLHDENNLEKFLQQTGGDFGKSNIIASMGEEFGMSAYGKPYLRNAINDFTYSPPETLPHIPSGPDELGGESHYFAPLFVGAFYDILGSLFHSYEEKGMSQKEALVKTGEIAGTLLAKGLEGSPSSDADYKDLALAILKADLNCEKGEHKDLILDVFRKRKILSEDDLSALSMPENFDYDDDMGENSRTELHLVGPEYGMFNGAVIDIKNNKNSYGFFSGDKNSGVEKTKDYMKKLIKDGRIKFVEPGKSQNLKDEDFFDKNGRPYTGYTSYEDGKMKIVKSPIII